MKVSISLAAAFLQMKEISIKMTITLREGPVLIVYIIQSFQKFFVSLFVKFPPLSGQPYANNL